MKSAQAGDYTLRFAALVSLLLCLCAPAFTQTPHVPTSAALPQSVPSSTYPATIQTVRRVCAAAVSTACTSGGNSNFQETGNGAGLAAAINDVITNRGTLCNTGACEILIDSDDFNKNSGTCISRGSSYNLSGAGSHEIIIRTSASTMPAQGTRITPANYDDAPCLESSLNNVKVFTFSLSSAKFRWMGLYIRQKSGTSGGSLIEVSNNTADTSAEIPDGIWLDRSFLGCEGATQTCNDGIQLNAKNSGVVDSVITGIKDGGDANAVVFWNTTGNILIDNNELSSSGESLLTGGATMPNTGDQYNPTDITITRNYLHMPSQCLTDKASWSCKNLLELKTGVRVLIEGNILADSVQDGQNGQCFNFKSSNSGNSNTWAVTRDVTVRHNICRNLEGEGFSIQAWNGVFGSQLTQLVTIHDNLFDGASNGIQSIGFMGSPLGSGTCSVAGCPVAANDQITKSVFIYNNTWIASARVHTSLKGSYVLLDVAVPLGNARCSDSLGMHNNILPLWREGGGTRTNSTDAAKCAIDGVQNNGALGYSHDEDSAHGNYLMNADAASITTPNLTGKLFAFNPAGRSADQCSNFTSCTAGNIGTGANDYTGVGLPSGADLGSGVRAVGADIAKVNNETCGALSGDWSCFSQGGSQKPVVPRGRMVPR